MTLQTEVEDYLVTDLFTLAETSLRLQSASAVYLDRRAKVHRSDTEILVHVRRGNPQFRRTGRAVIIQATIELFVATSDPYVDPENRPEDRLRATTELIMEAYDADRGAARFSSNVSYPVDVVECYEISDYDEFPPSLDDRDSRTHYIKRLQVLIHAYEN